MTFFATTGCSTSGDTASSSSVIDTDDDTDDGTGTGTGTGTVELNVDDAASAASTDDDSLSDDPTTVDPTSDAPATITSFDDIPQECLDLTADFLRKIEPIVSPIDWANATMNDFESIASAFEAEAEAFDTRSADACAGIDLADDGLSVMIEFAEDEAPGTAEFLTFLDQLQNAALGIQPSLDDASPAFDDCAGAIEFIEALLTSYESIVDVPVDDMLQVSLVGTVFPSCTPEQQEFFESAEVTAFFGE